MDVSSLLYFLTTKSSHMISNSDHITPYSASHDFSSSHLITTSYSASWLLILTTSYSASQDPSFWSHDLF